MPTESSTIREPVLPEVAMHVRRPNDPATAVVTKNEICTASRKAAGFVRHIEIDLAGTGLEGTCVPGQSIGIIAPGEDAKGKPHRVRLYSLASPTAGEGNDGQGRVVSTTVKRLVDEHWEDGSLFLGVASNYLCSLQPGDEVKVSGPNGKRFVLPEHPEDHDYVFIATGTGIAPFRGMVLDLLGRQTTSSITLLMGAPYATDLLYHQFFEELARTHEQFNYVTAISRETQSDGEGRLYVQDRLRTHKEQLLPVLQSERTLIYVCGIAGMELGIFKTLTREYPEEVRAQYLRVDPEAMEDIDGWNRKMLHKQIAATRRMLLEVYA
ncbi:MAG: hypothetical protein AAFX05_01395 [Planctomycetota bacterium]